MKKLIMYLMLMVILAIGVSATGYNNTRMESVGLLTNISVNETIYADLLVIGDTGIYFENYTFVGDGSTGNLTTTFNISDASRDLIQNTSTRDLPSLATVEAGRISVSSNINQTVNGSVLLFIPCRVDRASGTTIFTNRVTYQNQTWNEDQYTCTVANQAGLSLLNIPNGTSYITYTTRNEGQASCNNLYNSITSSFALGMLALIVMAAATIIGALLAANTGDIKALIASIMVGGLFSIVGIVILTMVAQTLC